MFFFGSFFSVNRYIEKNMQKHSALHFVLPILLLALGCSVLDLTEDQQQQPSVAQEDHLKTKGVDDPGPYYYYFDEQIFLKERRDLLLVCFTGTQERREFIQELNNVSCWKVWNPTLSENWAEDNAYNLLILQTASGGEFPEDQIEELLVIQGVKYVSYMYGNDEDHLSSVSDEFSVKLRGRSAYSSLKKMAQEFGCKVVCYDGFDEGIYFVRRPKDSEYGTMLLSAIFYETGQFEFTSPGFFWFGASSSNDTYYVNQWGLKNTGQNGSGTSGFDINIESAWAITEGSSDIIVAVLDNGVELTHPDLSANLVTGYDAVDTVHAYGGAPMESLAGHGTAVAGIIGAVKDNAIGISGVAPGCKIMPIRVGFYNPISNGEEIYLPAAIKGFNWARTHGADVINCSWGGGAECSLLTSAIHNAATSGRNGKGCVVVFSSGNTPNGDNNNVAYPGYLGDVIAVGAISYDGKRKNLSSPDGESWSSNYGPTLDVVAPGVFIYTTDRQGDNGYNTSSTTTNLADKAYTKIFNGTSSAAPHVAGVAALILSNYPDLDKGQVKRAMERSATRPSGYTYITDYQYPSGKRCDQVGYGIVNAYGALSVASQYHQQNIMDALSGIDVTITNNSSYYIDEVSFELYGTIGGTVVTLFSESMEPIEGGGHMVGYPLYRGSQLFAAPGSPISSIYLEFYARCSDCPGDLRIAAAMDTPYPTNFETFSFGDGDFYVRYLPDSTVPNASRRRLYIYILDE